MPFFFQNLIITGNKIDAVINLHNVESRESPHLFAPLLSSDKYQASIQLALLKSIRERSKSDEFDVATQVDAVEKDTDNSRARLGAWLNQYFSILHLPFEVNSQELKRHLSIQQLEELGSIVMIKTFDFIISSNGLKWQDIVSHAHDERDLNWQKYGNKLLELNNALESELRVQTKARCEKLRMEWGDQPPGATPFGVDYNLHIPSDVKSF